MIYLIWGPPKCGKTTLAKKLSKLKGISCVSTDTLQNIIKPYINKKDLLKKFPTSKQREKNNDEKYSKYSIKEIINAYKIQAKTSHEAIDMFIVSEITDGNDFIIEWYHIEPKFVTELKLKYPNQIQSIFITKTDESKFIWDIKKSTTPNDWIIKRTNNSETYSKIAKMVCKYSKFFEEESKKYSLNFLNMDNDFDNKIDEIIHNFIKKKY